MPLTPEQFKTGIAYFTLLAQIQHRLDMEATNEKQLPAPPACIRVTRTKTPAPEKNPHQP